MQDNLNRFGLVALATDLTIEGDPEVSHVVPGHRTLIFEIVSNLIDNGIRYNRRGGTVSVRLQTTPSETTIAVVDDLVAKHLANEHRLLAGLSDLERTRLAHLLEAWGRTLDA